MVSARLQLILSLCVVIGVRAQSSLYIPGFDPQAISVDQVGVGADGRTTYVLQPGTPTDTDEDVGFIGTATLVAGPSDIFLTYADALDGITMGIDCSISDSLAACTYQDGLETFVTTETVQPMAIQLASTTAATASTTSAPPASTISGSRSLVSGSVSATASSTSGTTASSSAANSSRGLKATASQVIVVFVAVGCIAGFA